MRRSRQLIKGEHLGGRGLLAHRLRIARPQCGGARNGMPLNLVPRPGQRLRDGASQAKRGQADDCCAEPQKAMARPQRGCCQVARDDCGDGNADITGELVQPDDEAALVGPREVELGRLRHRPGQALVDAEQDGGEDDPGPTGRKDTRSGMGNATSHPSSRTRLRPICSAMRPAMKFIAPFTKPKATTNATRSMNEPRGHAELGLFQRRHDIAHHPDGHAHEQHLQQLLQELTEVDADAEVHLRTQAGRHFGRRAAQVRLDDAPPCRRAGAESQSSAPRRTPLVHRQHRVEALLEPDGRRRLARQAGAAGAARPVPRVDFQLVGQAQEPVQRLVQLCSHLALLPCEVGATHGTDEQGIACDDEPGLVAPAQVPDHRADAVGVWPGVWMTSTSTLPDSSRWPSCSGVNAKLTAPGCSRAGGTVRRHDAPGPDRRSSGRHGHGCR